MIIIKHTDIAQAIVPCSSALQPNFSRVVECYISILYFPTHSNFSPLFYLTSISQDHQWPSHIQIHLKKVDSQSTLTQRHLIWLTIALLKTLPSPCSWYTDLYMPILSIIMHLWNDCNVLGTVLSSLCVLSNLFLITTLKSLTSPFALS